MKASSVSLFLLVLLAVNIPAWTQTPRQTLQQDVLDLQKYPNDDALREKIIMLVQTMKLAPATPEDARKHFVMATTLIESAKDNNGYELAITEFKAAILVAPWWAEAYQKLAIAQKAAGSFDDAIASLNFYLMTHPANARDAQDEIYKLEALKKAATDQQLRRQQEEQQQRAGDQMRKLEEEEERRRQGQAAVEATKNSFEGSWYYASPYGGTILYGDESKPECDYVIRSSGGHWEVVDSPCNTSKYSIDQVSVRGRVLEFRLSYGKYFWHEVTLTLSGDGNALEGSNIYFHAGRVADRADARLIRRKR